ncbi:MAG: hypothetical protein A2583_12075 [Bdellovibrionales bacterium RIFOXYD1_FULL_53_11]|nr:MAG: hypothetical protein A2583_12075 [Bdellovibrionales bacterium RIFOXYD1_FULL_53_11]
MTCLVSLVLLLANIISVNATDIAIIRFEGIKQTFRVEVAKSIEQKKRGLMGRKSIPPDGGMLFVFDEEEIHTFWMKDTFIPLDIVFIGKDLRVKNVIHSTTPLSTGHIGNGIVSKYVLELPGGAAKKSGITIKNKLSLPPG